MSETGATPVSGYVLGRRGFVATFLKYKERYLLLALAIVLFFVFRYVPMAGLVLAWKKFTVSGGLFGSPWGRMDLFRAPVHRSRLPSRAA